MSRGRNRRRTPRRSVGATRLKQTAQPNRKIPAQTDLHAGHAFDAADHRQCRAATEHSRRFEDAGHAGAALHDGGERRHMRIELGFEPHFARQIGVGEIDNHRAPYREVDRTGDLPRHRLDHGHRQAERVALGEWSVDIDERRSQSGHQPNRWSAVVSRCHGQSPLRRRAAGPCRRRSHRRQRKSGCRRCRARPMLPCFSATGP